MASPYPKIPDTEFVAIWQQARSLREVAQLCGYDTPQGRTVATNRARRLRRLGVKLRRMSETTPGDVRRLNAIAKRVEARVNP